MEYDVIVVGAGIPGLYAARQLARAGFKTIILDQSKIPGEPNYSTAGIPISTLKEFELPEKGVVSSVHKIICSTKDLNVVWSDEKIVSHVLDFRKMKQLLAQEVEKSGGDVKWGVTAYGLLFADHKIIGVKTSLGEIYGKYFIDATGHVGTLAVAAGIRLEIPGKISSALEYIIQAENNKLEIYKDSLLSFPLSKHKN